MFTNLIWSKTTWHFIRTVNHPSNHNQLFRSFDHFLYKINWYYMHINRCLQLLRFKFYWIILLFFIFSKITRVLSDSAISIINFRILSTQLPFRWIRSDSMSSKTKGFLISVKKGKKNKETRENQRDCREHAINEINKF